MSQIYRRVLLAVLGLAVSTAAWGLDFENEIQRQERQVKVKYQKSNVQFSTFLKFYPECKIHRGTRRARCNIAMAKKRFYAYRQELFKKNQQVAAHVETGDMDVLLTPKPDKRSPTASY